MQRAYFNVERLLFGERLELQIELLERLAGTLVPNLIR